MSPEMKEKLRSNIKVAANGCWIWNGPRDHRGYGRIYLPDRQQTFPVHRITWELLYKTRFPAGMEVHHTCNNRACCNPRHIEVLTHAEHMALHAKTGVWAGSANSQAKLTEEKGLAIRALDSLGIIPKMQLAASAKIPYRTYHYLINGGVETHTKCRMEDQKWTNTLSRSDKKQVIEQLVCSALLPLTKMQGYLINISERCQHSKFLHQSGQKMARKLLKGHKVILGFSIHLELGRMKPE